MDEREQRAFDRGKARRAEREKRRDGIAPTLKSEDDIKESKKNQRVVAKNTKKEMEIYNKLYVRQKESKKVKERMERWENCRLEILDKCETEEQFKKLTEELDKVDEKDFFSEDGIGIRFEWIKPYLPPKKGK